ncbi:hypothetical protein FCR2A7T_29580 [Flavobacterium cauense R2A-7]|uniref:TetR family transcriptional regulator n=1 Tax=Flavobacterium cauense R2A-7 TaxID=1341154 RepID=V6RW74_9FLAO|nr:TetR family transcriptional regulator [Flavobacterium cauense]ESU18434.1 hypothetical protein FCR2A7T_29580 [Flavobacterium cauense R2A-7]KGO79459.1 hypothetical protein Q762_14245 [Flavobacterium cauense R2A-7]TWI08092.1 TetR family transcriptional regulator [Flavobacterium cauense R2A-7]
MVSQEKKEIIKQTAFNLFSKNGFEATSVREIAKQANVNLAMISYYFNSKEQLLEDIIEEKLNDIKIYDTEITNSKNVEESLAQIIEILLKKILKNQAFFNLLHSELSLKQRVVSSDVYYRVKKHNDTILQTIIKQGIQEKVFFENKLLDTLSIYILGPYINFILNKKYYSEKLQLNSEKLLENYINTILIKNITTSAINLLKIENDNK